MSKHQRVLPYLLLGGAQLAVGAAAIFARYALTGAQPIAVAAARLCIAAIVLLLLSAIRRAPRAKVGPRDNVILACAGVALALHFAGWIWSLEYTTIAISTLLVASTPIWTAIYDATVHKRGLSRASMAAFAAGAVGLVLVVGFNKTPAPHPGHEWAGYALALIGSVAIGAYFILVRDVREGIGTRRVVTRTYTWAAIVLTLAAFALRQPPPPISATAAWGGILAMAFVSQLLGHTALNASLRSFTPSAIAFATLLEPVIAAALGLVIFHEAVPPLALVGGFILLAAIGVVLREEQLDRSGSRIGAIHPEGLLGG